MIFSSNNITFDFDPKIDYQKDLEKMILDAYQKNKDFFKEDKIEIKIKFLYQRSQMDKICGCKTRDWEVGQTTKEKQIFIFSPNVFDKVSNHPISDFEYILTHEMAHLFIKEFLLFNYPKWLDEGVAGYVAKQYKIRPLEKINKFSDLHDKEKWNKFNNYPQAFSFTKYLIDKFGEDKILDFLKNIKTNIGSMSSYDEFVKFFNKFLKTDFNEEASFWSKSF